MPDVACVPSAEELAALPHDELAARLAEAYRAIAWLTARVELLERRAGRDSSTSSKPPSSDSPYQKKPRDRSLRERGKRRPGKQPGAPGTTMKLVDDPDHRLWFPPASCRECGTNLADAPVIAQRRHQVTDIQPAPPPVVREYVALAKQCPWCEAVSERELPAHVRARASFGPEAHAQAANLTCANHIPVQRAAGLISQMAGVTVSAGWVAGVRPKAAALVAASGFTDRIKELLKDAPAVHADETPARAAGGMRYVHLACTAYLTLMHTGDRSADAIDAGGVLPGYTGSLSGTAITPGTGTSPQRCTPGAGRTCSGTSKTCTTSSPATRTGQPGWPACSSRPATPPGTPARRERQPWTPVSWTDLVTRYRALATSGLAANAYRRTATATDARRIARRFLNFEDMILRFATRPDLDIFTNNEAERTIRPVKVQQRSSGGCWRTIEGLADFAVIQSYLSTAAKWGISKLGALRDLFNGHAWMPSGLEPSG